MLIPLELKEQIEQIIEKSSHLWNFLEIENKKERLLELDKIMSAQDFWNNQESAQKILSEAKSIKRTVSEITDLNQEVEDLKVLKELCEESEEDESTLAELENVARDLVKTIDKLELQAFLSEPLDQNNAIMSIHAGAGGTESCDWANMLFRMYMRWAERSGFKTEIQSMQEGEEAGISRVTFRIVGHNVYGYSKAERGVHRLVRISPFDSNKKRHTSFCSVDVVAEVEEDIDVEIKDEDIRIDTYRASGKGGQHVNKTDSAVRITHLTSGIVVTCQNERSQIKNKATAMKTLKSRLYEKMLDEKRSDMERFYGEKGEIGWGNQIRSYVFQPYQMVKDLRTGEETSNVQAVLDGDIDKFIQAWLRAGCPKTRNKG